MRYLLLTFLLAAHFSCFAQSDISELNRAFDSTSLEELLLQQVDSLEDQLEYTWLRKRESDRSSERHLQSVERDVQFQLLVEELEFQKGNWRKVKFRQGLYEPSSNATLYNAAEQIHRDDDPPALYMCVADTGHTFQKRIAAMDRTFARLYPYTFSLLRTGKVVIVYFPEEQVAMTMHAPLDFPPFYYPQSANSPGKEEIAGIYLDFLQRYCSEQFFADYLKEERKRIPSGDVDAQIKARRNFIYLLKSKKAACK